MNKEKFLKKLNTSLRNLSADERDDIIRDFEEHFMMGLTEGKTEEEIARALGSPTQIGKELLAEYHLEKVETTATAGNIFRAVWAVIGLSFFNLVIVLGPFIALIAIILAGWAVAVSFIVSPLLFIINSLIYPQIFSLFELFFSIGLAGLGLLIAIGVAYASRAVTSGFIRYLKYNVSIVKGGMKNV